MANTIKPLKIKKRDLDEDILNWLNQLSSLNSENVSMNILNKKIEDLQEQAVLNSSLQSTLADYFNKKKDKVDSSIVAQDFYDDLAKRFMSKDKKIDYGDLSDKLNNDLQAVNSFVNGDTMSSLQGRVTNLEVLTKDIKSISDNIGNLNIADLSQGIKNLSVNMSEVQSDISNLDKRVSKCEQTEQQLKNTDSILQNDINLLKAKISSAFGIDTSNDTDGINSQSKASTIFKTIRIIDANNDDSEDEMKALEEAEVPFILTIHGEEGYGTNMETLYVGEAIESEIKGSIMLTSSKYTGSSNAIFLIKIMNSSTSDNPSGTKFCWCKVGSEKDYIGKLSTLGYSAEISVAANTDYSLSDGIKIRFIGGGFRAGDIFAMSAEPNKNISSKMVGAKKFAYIPSNIDNSGNYTDWKKSPSVNNTFLNIVDYGLYYDDDGTLNSIFTNSVKYTSINVKTGETVEQDATETQFYHAKIYVLDDNNRMIIADHYISLAYSGGKIYLTNNADSDVTVTLAMPESGGDLL